MQLREVVKASRAARGMFGAIGERFIGSHVRTSRRGAARPKFFLSWRRRAIRRSRTTSAEEHETAARCSVHAQIREVQISGRHSRAARPDFQGDRVDIAVNAAKQNGGWFRGGEDSSPVAGRRCAAPA